MVTVEKVRGNRVRIRGIGRFERGDRATVDEDTAAYLCDERGDFRRVDGSPDSEDEPPDQGADVDHSADEDEPAEDEPVDDGDEIAAQIDAGECPWCDEYTGENVGMHASRAHPEAWAAYNED